MSSVLADHLQIWGLEEDIIIFSDSSLGFGLEVTPVDVSCFDDERINSLSEASCQFLNGLPSGIDIQFIQEIGRGSQDTINEHERLGHNATNPIAKALCNERAARLTQYENNNLLPKHGLKIFIRKPMGRSLIRKPKIFGKTRHFEDVAHATLREELLSVRRLRDDISGALPKLGLVANPIAAKQLMTILYEQWNPTRQIPMGACDPDDLRSSLLFTDISINESGFSLGEMHYRVLSLKILPDNTMASMAAALRALPFDSKFFLSIHVPDQQRELESLQMSRRLAFSMAKGKKSGVSDIESESKLVDLETLLEQMITQGEKVFHVSFNVLLRSQDLADLNEQVSQTLMKLRELSGAEGMTETLAAFDIFCQLAMPNARSKERSRKIKTSNLADFLPIYGPWEGHREARVLLRSRAGSLLKFDPFSMDLTNANQIVSGGSGAGKSFFTNILLLQMLKENPKIFILDIGGSYKKLAENLSGQYVSLALNSDLALNPFDLSANETKPSSQKLKFLVSLVEMMTKEEAQVGLGRLERTELENAITQVYESQTSPCLSILRDILLAHQDTEIRRLGRILSAWCGDTPYGRMVDRPSTIELHRPIVCFDLKGMETYPDLQAVCLLIITDFVWREIQKDRSTMKFTVFDECWKLLEVGHQFIAEVFRTYRKYYASAIAISQNIDDFAKSKVASAVMPNSAIKWILMQKGADQKRLQEVLQLNDNELRLVNSLHQERGVYSECLLLAQDQHTVAVVESTPLEYWIATTDPRDMAEIEASQKLYPEMPTMELLQTLSVKFPHGVVSARRTS
ncbi:MAG: ATP-binding protein [Bdellovibrionia bacterium]